MLNTVSSFSAAQVYNKNTLPHKNTNPSLKFGNLKSDKFERSTNIQAQPSFKGNVKLPIDEIRKSGVELIKKNQEIKDPQIARDNMVNYVNKNLELVGKSINPQKENALIKEKSDTVQRGDFTRDLSHEIYGSYISHRINMLYLWGIDDPEIANMFKHLNMGEMTGDATKTIKNFTNDIVKHTNSTTKLYQKFFDEGLDDATKKVSMRKIFDMVNESLKERKNCKNIDITVENEQLLDSPQGITNKGYKNYIIMSNLIENAIKYSEKDTQIKVKFDIKDDKLHFGVEDQGRGIIPEDQSKVVGPERGSNVQDVPGTGYGLYRISSILEFADLPKLEITSPIHFEEAVKKGTRIETFLLPTEEIK